MGLGRVLNISLELINKSTKERCQLSLKLDSSLVNLIIVGISSGQLTQISQLKTVVFNLEGVSESWGGLVKTQSF